jgi:hypothetical protein
VGVKRPTQRSFSNIFIGVRRQDDVFSRRQINSAARMSWPLR